MLSTVLFILICAPIVGYMAAKRNGWNPAMGIIGGLLLGVLSPLLFFVNATVGKPNQVKCPFCTEWVKIEAKVCKHCHRDLVAQSSHARSGQSGTITLPRR